jgi:hypothetical protein
MITKSIIITVIIAAVIIGLKYQSGSYFETVYHLIFGFSIMNNEYPLNLRWLASLEIRIFWSSKFFYKHLLVYNCLHDLQF